ncbi:Zuotin [Pichia kudriavzevii]|uniref:Zuotin n=1 Tax=Pichia kudriavzevii TaxID=4909 RepID=A0A1V2LSJ7_PICKU|nr:Zuotin [Pichia kudriavzevii]
MTFTALASYSTAVRRPIEPVGPYFLAHATRTIKGHSWSEFEKIEAEKNVVTVEAKDSDEDLFDESIDDEELLNHDPRDWKSCDLYAALGLSKLKNKKSSAGGSLTQDGFFKIIQKAYETLMDPIKRRQFDSVDEFANISPPSTKPADEDFYAAWGPVFLNEARFSNKQPVPTLGDASSSKEEVEAFYKFWNNFDSWRTFEWLDEDVPDDSANRDHKRYIEKKNNNSRKKKKTEDNKRLSDLVKRAQSEDPRIKAFKEAEKEEKARKKWEREAGARKAAEDAKAKAEAEAKAKADAEAAAKAEKENAKKAKEAAKAAKKKNKRAIRAAAKDNEYFGDADKSASIDADIDLLIESFDDVKLGDVAGKLKGVSADAAKAVLSQVAAEQTAAGKVSSLSYFN